MPTIEIETPNLAKQYPIILGKSFENVNNDVKRDTFLILRYHNGFKPATTDQSQKGTISFKQKSKVFVEFPSTDNQSKMKGFEGLLENATPQEFLVWFDAANECFVLERLAMQVKALKYDRNGLGVQQTTNTNVKESTTKKLRQLGKKKKTKRYNVKDKHTTNINNNNHLPNNTFNETPPSSTPNLVLNDYNSNTNSVENNDGNCNNNEVDSNSSDNDIIMPVRTNDESNNNNDGFSNNVVMMKPMNPSRVRKFSSSPSPNVININALNNNNSSNNMKRQYVPPPPPPVMSNACMNDTNINNNNIRSSNHNENKTKGPLSLFGNIDSDDNNENDSDINENDNALDNSIYNNNNNNDNNNNESYEKYI